MEILVIYNPHAGNGRARRLLPGIRRYLAELAIDADILMTERSGHAITLAAQPEKLHVMYWDTKVAQHEVFTREQMGTVVAATKPKGGGGTTPSCVTKYMAANNIKPKVCIVLTDGEVGGDWGGTWPSPVLWVILGNKNARPDVGVVVHAED